MMKISYKKFGAFAATAVLAGILAGCGSGMNADANDMARPAAMQQEKAAGRIQNFMDAKDADFMLTDVNGKEHRLSDYRGKRCISSSGLPGVLYVWLRWLIRICWREVTIRILSFFPLWRPDLAVK